MSEFTYSDGDSAEQAVLNLLQSADNLSSKHRIGWNEYASWATRYHLCPERGNLLRHFDFSNLKVLELGAGMGAVSRSIAETASHLTIVEGSARRLKAASARLRDLQNWTGVQANIVDYTTSDRYDVICVIGVLEYSELYVRTEGDARPRAPFLKVLEHIVSLLKPGGVLLLAIENSLGLKYFAGCEEDHRNHLFDSVVGYPDLPTARTFSKKELAELLLSSGFKSSRFYYPFPDYKIPTAILTEDFVKELPTTAAEIAGGIDNESYVQGRVRIFPEALAFENVSEAGLVGEFSNSFLVMASVDAVTQTLERLTAAEKKGQQAWLYTRDRLNGVKTVFSKVDASSWSVVKTPLFESLKTSDDGFFSWKCPAPTTVHLGRNLKTVLLRKLYFRDYEGFYTDLKTYCAWALAKYGPLRDVLDPEALDATFINVQVQKSVYTLFDLEWRAEKGISSSWFLFRNVMQLQSMRYLLPAEGRLKNLLAIYEDLCRDLNVAPSFEQSLQSEMSFQKFASGREMPESDVMLLRNFFEGQAAYMDTLFGRSRNVHEIRMTVARMENMQHENQILREAVTNLQQSVSALQVVANRSLPVFIGARLAQRLPFLKPLAARIYFAIKAMLGKSPAPRT